MSEGRSTYDAEADAAYVSIAPTIPPGAVAANVVIERERGTIVLDFDAEGRVLGVEILGARTLLTPEALDAADRIG